MSVGKAIVCFLGCVGIIASVPMLLMGAVLGDAGFLCWAVGMAGICIPVVAALGGFKKQPVGDGVFGMPEVGQPASSGQSYLLFNPLGEEQRRAICDPGNPLHQIVGNEEAVQRLCEAAFLALGRTDHALGDRAFCLVGPSSSVKATLARHFAQLLGLPFVEIQPEAVQSANDLLVRINEVLERIVVPVGGAVTTLELMAVGRADRLVVPPCVVFLNDFHRLPSDVVVCFIGAVDSGVFETGKWLADTSKICWMVGTICDAADERFTNIQVDPS
jgi:hypothetical protein